MSSEFPLVVLRVSADAVDGDDALGENRQDEQPVVVPADVENHPVPGKKAGGREIPLHARRPFP